MLTKFTYNAFSLVHKVADGYHEYHHFYVTPEEYHIIETIISDSRTSGNRADALKYLRDREDELFKEASLNNGVLEYDGCASYVDTDLLMYETTSGTILSRDLYDDHIISLPINRLKGCHHRIILLVLAGLTADELNRYENLFMIDDKDEFEYTYKERKVRYDSILIPYGYDAYLSWEEHIQFKEECKADKARIAREASEWPVDSAVKYDDWFGF